MPENISPETRAAINRINAQHSTGPKTDAGKKQSSLNATRHGLTGQVVVLPTDDLDAYGKFVQKFHTDMFPKGAMEDQIVQTIADTSWRINRGHAFENNTVVRAAQDHLNELTTDHAQVQDAFAMAAAAAQHAKTLANISIYLQRAHRIVEKNLKLLRELQAERKERERVEMQEAMSIMLLHKEENRKAKVATDYNPQGDGFVFSLAEIESRLHRKTRAKDARRFLARAA